MNVLFIFLQKWKVYHLRIILELLGDEQDIVLSGNE